VGNIDSDRLAGGDLTKTIALPFGTSGDPAWVQLDFGQPVTVTAMSLALEAPGVFFVNPLQVAAELQGSLGGSEFKSIVNVYQTQDTQQTVSFAPTKARFFRLLLPKPTLAPVPPVAAALIGPPPTAHHLAEFVLFAASRVDHFERKAGFFIANDSGALQLGGNDTTDAIAQTDVRDLSLRMHSDGSFRWTPPPGEWVVLRVGASLVGSANHPAAFSGTGLEVDKLSRARVHKYLEDYLHLYESFLGPNLMGTRGLHVLISDSWEAGVQNWTEDLPQEFKRRRGYNLLPWFPALTGRVIQSSKSTDKFLWDYRRTLAELLAENHYGEFSRVLHKRGMLHYSESHEAGRAFIGDGMDVKRYDDVPTSAMWVAGFLPQEGYDADIRESASVAHLYGQNLVAAESLTALGTEGAAFAFSPAVLKPTADREFLDGVNQFIIHASVHQPLLHKSPGVVLGPFGQWFTRNETWAEQAGPWVTYLSRCAYLLQQGRSVADVLYYYGQDSNITALYAKQLPPIPEGYTYDFVSADSLKDVFVQNGVLTTKSGPRYRLLALDPRTTLTSRDVLVQISKLVAAGATLVGDKPTSTPSLSDDERHFQALVDAMWGSEVTREHHYGLGRVLSGAPTVQVMQLLGVTPDFARYGGDSATAVGFIHRRLTDGEVYFVVNRNDRPETFEARFRVTGKAAEFWHPDTGEIEPASYQLGATQTLVPIHLEPHESKFVVFRQPAQQNQRTVAESEMQVLAPVTGPWRATFGLPLPDVHHETYASLQSWSESRDLAIKYFAGTARYESSLVAPSTWFQPGREIDLDLGTVKDVAELSVNDQVIGVLWKPPFRTNITRWLHPGANSLTVRVTNLWPNRLIGDKQPNASSAAPTTFNPYEANSPLLPSGLLGPVLVLSISKRQLN
jgi:hypothetical protein